MIKINFLDGVENVQSPNHLYQWDKGQQIEISGLGDVGTPEIHIGYTGVMLAVVVNSTVSNGKIYVNIPNKVLMTGKDLRVHINIATTNSNTTIKSILIPVVKRNMPENYVIEDGDLQWIEEFKDEVIDFNNRITSNSDELVDVRTKADGTISTSAGNAVREQFNELQKAYEDLTTAHNELELNSNAISGVLEYTEDGGILNLITDCTKVNIVLGGEYTIFGYTDKQITFSSGKLNINGTRICTLYLDASFEQSTITISANSIIKISVFTDDVIVALIKDIDCFDMASYMESAINRLKSDLGKLEARYSVDYGTNRLNMDDVVRDAYLNTSDGITKVVSSSYGTTGYIKVNRGDTIYPVQHPLGSGNSAQTQARFCYFFDKNKNLLSYENADYSYTATEDGFIRVSMGVLNSTKESTYDAGIYINESDLSKWIPYKKPIVTLKTEFIPNSIPSRLTYVEAEVEKLQGPSVVPYIRKTGNISDGDVWNLEINNIMANKRFVLVGTLGTLGTLLMGHGTRENTPSSWIELTESSLIVHHNLTTQTTLYHGLSLVNNIMVSIEQPQNYTAKITIISNGAKYVTEQEWNGNIGKIFIESDGTLLTDCVASWCCSDFFADIWAYGDSYFGMENPARWMYHLITNGYANNVLMDGYPGRGSADAYTSLQNTLKHGKPKYILWCMGMNNPDSDSAVNNSWNVWYLELKSYCEENGIELVLSTIPNCPNQNNTFKNAIVRESGLRYIDFAKAVGAEDLASGWYEGMLSTDNIHPTEKGAITLYLQALADFPELMLN